MRDQHLFPGADALLTAAATEVQQKDDLCGPLWVAVALRALGAGHRTQEEAAIAAGTVLAPADGASLPSGATRRREYACELPSTEDLSQAGTDVAGVVQAVDELSAGALTTTPIDPRGWEVAHLNATFDVLAETGVQMAVILNVATEQYRFVAEEERQSFLDTGRSGTTRESGWAVGHFVGLLGWSQGARGRLYLVHDTYPARLLVGAAESSAVSSPWVHEQPAQALLEALRRPGRPCGAVLVVTAAEDREVVQAAVSAAGEGAP